MSYKWTIIKSGLLSIISGSICPNTSTDSLIDLMKLTTFIFLVKIKRVIS